MAHDLPGGTHERWGGRTNRSTGAEDYPEAWYSEQCGDCIFWIPLTAPAGLDWGACANEAAPFDGTVRFEHDGCDGHTPDPTGWRTP